MSQSKVLTSEEVKMLAAGAEAISKFGSKDAALSRLMFEGPDVLAIFRAHGFSTLQSGVMMRWITEAGKTAASRAPQQDREQQRDNLNKIFSMKNGEDPVQVEVSRKTKEVRIVPADPVHRLSLEPEQTRPGFTNLLGDLVTCYNLADVAVKPYGDLSTWNGARPAPAYSYSGLVTFAIEQAEVLRPMRVEGQHLPMYSAVALLAERLSSMPILDYLKVQTSFYAATLDLKIVKLQSGNEAYQIPRGYPISQIGKYSVCKEPFFSHWKEVPAAQRSLFLMRFDRWPVTSPPPATTEDAIRRLQLSRAWRGENQSRYSGLTRGHRNGGDLSDIRIRVNRALCVLRPLWSKEARVDFRPESTAYIPHIHKEYLRLLALQLVKSDMKFVVDKETAYRLMGADCTNYYVAEARGDAFLVDFVSTELPSFKKNTDVDKTWEAEFDLLLPKQVKFIARRKVPPRRAETVNVFSFGSAHAFDFLVSDQAEVLVREVEVEITQNEDGEDIVCETAREVALRRLTVASLRSIQNIDDRRKLSMYVEMKGITADSTMNNWIPPVIVSKKNRENLVGQLDVGPSGEYEEIDQFSDGSLREADRDVSEAEEEDVPQQAEDFG